MSKDGLAGLAGKRVLLAEDEAFVALDIAARLEDAGATVIGPLMRLPAVMDAAKAGADAAILDVDLAGQDVFPAARILADAGVPFVFYTGHGQRREIHSDFPDAVVAKKPLPVATLLSMLAALLKAS